MASAKTIANSLLLPLTQKFTLPQSLIYFVTARCNAGCDFCLYAEQLNNPESGRHELSAEEVTAIAKAYGRLHYLGVSGGEPFIRPDLYELCAAFARHCHVQVVDIPSNFFYGERMLAFVEKFAGEFPGVTVDLQLSLDNTGIAHDESRKVNGLYAKTVANFKMLYALKQRYPNLRLKINVVYLPQNKTQLLHILGELKETLAFDRIQLTYPHHLLPARGGNKELLNDLENFFSLAQQADNLTANENANDIYSVGLRAVKKVYRQLLQQAMSGKKNTGTYCHAGSHIVVMNETGDLFPCEILWNEKLGNVRQNSYSIKQVLASAAKKVFEKKYLQKGQCNCTWSCAFNTQVSVNYKYFPSLAANALGLIFNRHE